MVQSIKMTYLGTIVFAALFIGSQIDAKHYSREKKDECRMMVDSCKRVIDTASRCREICDVLAEKRSTNYLEDKKICKARCQENIAAIKDCIAQCKHHKRGMENKDERDTINRCIDKCQCAMHSCKKTIKECHENKSMTQCKDACHKSCGKLTSCIESCQEIIDANEGEMESPRMAYEIEECEY